MPPLLLKEAVEELPTDEVEEEAGEFEEEDPVPEDKD